MRVPRAGAVGSRARRRAAAALAGYRTTSVDAYDILIVDDSVTAVRMFADMLKDEGYRVRTAADGRAALEAVEARRPDLILLDVVMPEMDGYEVCRRLRAQGGDYVPVLMITAPDKLAMSLDAGADDFIGKPPSPGELTARVRSLLRIRALQKRLHEHNAELLAKNQQLEAQNEQLEAMSEQLQAQNQQLLAMSEELQSLNRALEELSVTDGLTRAHNHRHFQERLRSEFARAHRHGDPLSCVLIDVDRFKQVNDTHGHRAGDGVLVRLVELLKEGVRGEDFVARYGGEEFVLLLPKTPCAPGRQLAERIRQRVEEEAFGLGGGQVLHVTVSAGVADYHPGGPILDPGALVEAADQALFRAKRSGRNNVQVAGQAF